MGSLTAAARDASTQVTVTPENGMMFDAPHVLVQGLQPGQLVTLHLTHTDDKGLPFASHAHYAANNQGTVDLLQQQSLGGRFKGVFPVGLITTLRSTPEVTKKKPKLRWARLFKRDVTTPMEYTVSVLDGHLDEDKLYTNPATLASTSFSRNHMAPGVRRIEVEGKSIRGCLFLPPGPGPHPAVLDLFGIHGNLFEFRSALLASKGYAAFALSYMDYKDLPPLSDKLSIDYFEEGLDYMRGHPELQNDRLGFIGSSTGGGIGILLSTLFHDIKAVVAINPFHISIGVDFFHRGELVLKGTRIDTKSTHINFGDQKMKMWFRDEYFHWDVDNIFKTEAIPPDCHLLVASSDRDGSLVHRSALCLSERARRHNRDNVHCLVYPGAGHILDPPYHHHIDHVWTSFNVVEKKSGEGFAQYYGGHPYWTSRAAVDVWQRTLELFHIKLVQETGLTLPPP
ncbi:acyl-coenzyme A thioesterase 1-like [Oratosquilla oratoria]|uniref:acyl-coenzyme A thioesterase 1-like n=1 Tax=Oratosquilla oratoria TaxID=337810 RepID=UPI003F76F7E2